MSGVSVGETYESTTELGEARVPAALPSEFTDVLNGLNIVHHNKPSVFSEACNELCRYGYDHADTVGAKDVLAKCVAALKYKASTDDDETGPLSVPLASLKALSVLTTHAIVRGRIQGFQDCLTTIMGILQLPYATTEVRAEALTVILNCCCSRTNARVLGEMPTTASTVHSCMAPPAIIAVQSRALSVAVHMATYSLQFVKAFSEVGGIETVVLILAQPAKRVTTVVQHRAGLLLATLARHPALHKSIASAVAEAPVIQDAAAIPATARATSPSNKAGSASEDDDSNGGNGEDGKENEGAEGTEAEEDDANEDLLNEA